MSALAPKEATPIIHAIRLTQLTQSKPVAESALPPKADIGTRSRNVRYVPKADIGGSRAQTEKPPRGGFSKILNFKEATDGNCPIIET
jgi:hypothetical protein